MHVNIKFNGCVYPINITEHTTYAELYQQLLAMVKSQHPRIQALKIVTNGKPLQNTNTRISGEDYQELRDASGINAVESRSAAPAVASAEAPATVAASDPEPVVASPVAASGRAGAPAGIPESVDDSSRKKRRCLEQLSTSLNTYFTAPNAETLGEVKRLLTYYQDEGALKGMGDLDSQQKKLFHIELSTLQILADSNPTKQYASFLFTMNTIKGILSISSSDEPSQYKDLCAFMRSQLNLATTAAVHAAAVGGAGGPAASAASGPVIIPYIDTLQNYNQQVFAYFINELYRGLQFNPHQINFAQIKTLFSDTKIAAFSVNNPLELINELEGLLIDSNTLTSEAEKKVIEIMESLGRNIVDPARGKGRDLLTDIQRSVHQASQDKVAAAKLAESASAIAALHRVEDRSAVVVPAAAAARADDNRFIDYASSSVGQISVAAPALAGAAVVIAPAPVALAVASVRAPAPIAAPAESWRVWLIRNISNAYNRVVSSLALALGLGGLVGGGAAPAVHAAVVAAPNAAADNAAARRVNNNVPAAHHVEMLDAQRANHAGARQRR